MYEIRYGITLNEAGRPCIELPEDYDQNPEDKFFAIEIARYYLQRVFENMDSSIFDPTSFSVMDESISLLGQLGDEMAEIQYHGMRTQGQLMMAMNTGYHVKVNNIEERDALPEKNIYYNNRLFDRVEGLKVSVETDLGEGIYGSDRYELVDGITNEHWKKI